MVKEERELVKRVQALWEDDKTQEAIAGMHELVASDPTDYDLIEKLGDMYLAVGDYEASERQYAASIAILQQHPTQGLQRWTERMSYLLVKLGESKERSQTVDNRFDAAEAHYKKAIEVNPKCLEAYHRLAYLNLSEGYLQTAEELFDEGLKHATGHGLVVAELWYGKAESRMQNKDWRAASKLLEKACVADSTYAPAFFKLGLCLQEEKDWLSAIQAFDKYFDLFPTYYGSYGVDAVDQRLDSSGLLSDVLLRRGICYIHYGDTPSAIADLDAVLDFEHPNFLAYAHHFRGKAHFNESDFWQAIDDQTEAIKHDPELFDAYLDRSTCYDLVGMTKEAAEDKQKYELLKRAKSWDRRQAMIEGHFGGRRRQGELLDE